MICQAQACTSPRWTLLLCALFGERREEKKVLSLMPVLYLKKNQPTYDLCSVIPANLAPAGLLNRE